METQFVPYASGTAGITSKNLRDETIADKEQSSLNTAGSKSKNSQHAKSALLREVSRIKPTEDTPISICQLGEQCSVMLEADTTFHQLIEEASNKIANGHDVLRNVVNMYNGNGTTFVTRDQFTHFDNSSMPGYSIKTSMSLKICDARHELGLGDLLEQGYGADFFVDDYRFDDDSQSYISYNKVVNESLMEPSNASISAMNSFTANMSRLPNVPSYYLLNPKDPYRIYPEDPLKVEHTLYTDSGLSYEFYSADDRYRILNSRSKLPDGYFFDDVVTNRLELPLKQRANFGVVTRADVNQLYSLCWIVENEILENDLIIEDPEKNATLLSELYVHSPMTGVGPYGPITAIVNETTLDLACHPDCHGQCEHVGLPLVSGVVVNQCREYFNCIPGARTYDTRLPFADGSLVKYGVTLEDCAAACCELGDSCAGFDHKEPESSHGAGNAICQLNSKARKDMHFMFDNSPWQISSPSATSGLGFATIFGTSRVCERNSVSLTYYDQHTCTAPNDTASLNSLKNLGGSRCEFCTAIGMDYCASTNECIENTNTAGNGEPGTRSNPTICPAGPHHEVVPATDTEFVTKGGITPDSTAYNGDSTTWLGFYLNNSMDLYSSTCPNWDMSLALANYTRTATDSYCSPAGVLAESSLFQDGSYNAIHHLNQWSANPAPEYVAIFTYTPESCSLQCNLFSDCVAFTWYPSFGMPPWNSSAVQNHPKNNCYLFKNCASTSESAIHGVATYIRDNSTAGYLENSCTPAFDSGLSTDCGVNCYCKSSPSPGMAPVTTLSPVTLSFSGYQNINSKGGVCRPCPTDTTSLNCDHISLIGSEYNSCCEIMWNNGTHVTKILPSDGGINSNQCGWIEANPTTTSTTTTIIPTTTSTTTTTPYCHPGGVMVEHFGGSWKEFPKLLEQTSAYKIEQPVGSIYYNNFTRPSYKHSIRVSGHFIAPETHGGYRFRIMSDDYGVLRLPGITPDVIDNTPNHYGPSTFWDNTYPISMTFNEKYIYEVKFTAVDGNGEFGLMWKGGISQSTYTDDFSSVFCSSNTTTTTACPTYGNYSQHLVGDYTDVTYGTNIGGTGHPNNAIPYCFDASKNGGPEEDPDNPGQTLTSVNNVISITTGTYNSKSQEQCEADCDANVNCKFYFWSNENGASIENFCGLYTECFWIEKYTNASSSGVIMRKPLDQCTTTTTTTEWPYKSYCTPGFLREDYGGNYYDFEKDYNVQNTEAGASYIYMNVPDYYSTTMMNIHPTDPLFGTNGKQPGFLNYMLPFQALIHTKSFLNGNDDLLLGDNFVKRVNFGNAAAIMSSTPGLGAGGIESSSFASLSSFLGENYSIRLTSYFQAPETATDYKFRIHGNYFKVYLGTPWEIEFRSNHTEPAIETNLNSPNPSGLGKKQTLTTPDISLMANEVLKFEIWWSKSSSHASSSDTAFTFEWMGGSQQQVFTTDLKNVDKTFCSLPPAGLLNSDNNNAGMRYSLLSLPNTMDTSYYSMANMEGVGYEPHICYNGTNSSFVPYIPGGFCSESKKITTIDLGNGGNNQTLTPLVGDQSYSACMAQCESHYMSSVASKASSGNNKIDLFGNAPCEYIFYSSDDPFIGGGPHCALFSDCNYPISYNISSSYIYRRVPPCHNETISTDISTTVVTPVDDENTTNETDKVSLLNDSNTTNDSTTQDLDDGNVTNGTLEEDMIELPIVEFNFTKKQVVDVTKKTHFHQRTILEIGRVRFQGPRMDLGPYNCTLGLPCEILLHGSISRLYNVGIYKKQRYQKTLKKHLHCNSLGQESLQTQISAYWRPSYVDPNWYLGDHEFLQMEKENATNDSNSVSEIIFTESFVNDTNDSNLIIRLLSQQNDIMDMMNNTNGTNETNETDFGIFESTTTSSIPSIEPTTDVPTTTTTTTTPPVPLDYIYDSDFNSDSFRSPTPLISGPFQKFFATSLAYQIPNSLLRDFSVFNPSHFSYEVCFGPSVLVGELNIHGPYSFIRSDNWGSENGFVISEESSGGSIIQKKQEERELSLKNLIIEDSTSQAKKTTDTILRQLYLLSDYYYKGIFSENSTHLMNGTIVDLNNGGIIAKNLTNPTSDLTNPTSEEGTEEGTSNGVIVKEGDELARNLKSLQHTADRNSPHPYTTGGYDYFDGGLSALEDEIKNVDALRKDYANVERYHSYDYTKSSSSHSYDDTANDAYFTRIDRLNDTYSYFKSYRVAREQTKRGIVRHLTTQSNDYMFPKVKVGKETCLLKQNCIRFTEIRRLLETVKFAKVCPVNHDCKIILSGKFNNSWGTTTKLGIFVKNNGILADNQQSARESCKIMTPLLTSSESSSNYLQEFNLGIFSKLGRFGLCWQSNKGVPIYIGDIEIVPQNYFIAPSSVVPSSILSVPFASTSSATTRRFISTSTSSPSTSTSSSISSDTSSSTSSDDGRSVSFETRIAGKSISFGTTITGREIQLPAETVTPNLPSSSVTPPNLHTFNSTEIENLISILKTGKEFHLNVEAYFRRDMDDIENIVS